MRQPISTDFKIACNCSRTMGASMLMAVSRIFHRVDGWRRPVRRVVFRAARKLGRAMSKNR